MQFRRSSDIPRIDISHLTISLLTNSSFPRYIDRTFHVPSNWILRRLIRVRSPCFPSTANIPFGFKITASSETGLLGRVSPFSLVEVLDIVGPRGPTSNAISLSFVVIIIECILGALRWCNSAPGLFAPAVNRYTSKVVNVSFTLHTKISVNRENMPSSRPLNPETSIKTTNRIQ